MYLMYVDECGDCGLKPGSSSLFILSAIILHESYWTDVMTKLGEQRAEFRSRYGFGMDQELHACEMMGRTGKSYSHIGKADRASMLRQAVTLEASFDCLRVINVIVDKSDKDIGYDVFGHAWDALINRFEMTIEHDNFPHPDDGASCDHGMIIVDETDEKKLRDLIRRMRHGNFIASKLEPGTYIRHDLRYVIEDALHQRSETSMLIQMSDVNSYFLKQTIEPNKTVVKHGIKNLFYRLDPILLKQACRNDEFGIVRL